MVAFATPPIVPETSPVCVLPSIVLVESWLAVAPAAAPELIVATATLLTVPVILPALSKDLVLSGLLPAFNLCFSVELNLLSTLLCAVVAALDSAVLAFVVASAAALV